MRKKKWAAPELDSALFFEDSPENNRGNWKNVFKNPENPLQLELGCGKGVSTAMLAANTPQINIIAIDIKSDVLAVAKRNADAEFLKVGRSVDNLMLTALDIENLGKILSQEDKIERLLINFCNPWPKSRSQKHRLTHTRQLLEYKPFLSETAELHFKTDDDGLFEATKAEYLIEAGFDIKECIWDLDVEHPESRFLSEHEKMFRKDGLPIHYILAALR